MPSEHAKLSPSDAERWISCPAAIQATERSGIVEEESVYAREGTCAHALAEIKASYHFDLIDRKTMVEQRKKWHREFEDILAGNNVEVEMERHTDSYVELLDGRSQLYPNTQIALEQRLQTGIPRCWGTSDAVLASPQHVEIVDFKYGQGVAVQAQGNPQLRLYGVGALETYGDLLGETEVVRITVHQPRLDHVLTEEIDPRDLRAWRDDLIPVAEEALAGSDRFGPSEAACRWCPLSGRCRAQLESVFADVDFDEDPAELSPEEIANVYDELPRIRDWLKAFEASALDMAYSQGVPIPRYKVVRSGGQRRITDPEGALQFLTKKEGYTLDEVAKMSIRGVVELEKLLGKDEFDSLMRPYVTKSQGRESLVPEDDKRPSINPASEAAADFTKEDLI